MQILFFYDKNISYEQMHLLEHLLLHPKRKIKNGTVQLYSAVEGYPPINALTAGNFLALKLSCYQDDAEYLSELMLDLISDSLYLDKEVIENEIEILKSETEKIDPFGYLLEKYTENPFHKTQTIDDLEANPDIIMDWYLYTVKHNKPLVLVSGNTHHKAVAGAISKVNQWLQAQPEKRTNREILYHANLSLGNKTTFNGGDKELTLFGAMPHTDPQNYFHHTLLFFMLNDLLFELFRIEEGSDYSPYGMYRNTLYSQEMVFAFSTRFTSDKVYDYLKNFFYKDRNYFEVKKKKIAKMARLWQDQASEYYQIAQIYFFTKLFRRSSYVAEKILAIKYEDFMNYYQSRYDYCSVYSNQDIKVDGQN